MRKGSITSEQKKKEWMEFVARRRDIFEKIAKNLEKKKNQ